MSELSVACVGAGYFSQFHIGGWQRIDGARLVAISDMDLGKAQQTGLPAFADPVEMFAQTMPDIIDLIVPPASQASLIRAALLAKPKAIICQKPFCTSLSEAREVVGLAREAGIPLIIHENFRFQPWYREIARALSEGDIGTPLQATFRLRPGDGQGPNAYLDRQPYFQKMERFLVHETAVHLIDTFCFLFGAPTAIYADLRRVNPVIAGEDAGFIVFDFPSGVRAMFDGNRCLDHAAENPRITMGEALIEGTQGTLQLLGDGAVWLRSKGDSTQRCLLPAETTGWFGGDCARHLQAHVVEALAGLRPFENLSEDYLRTIELEGAVYRSSELGQKLHFT